MLTLNLKELRLMCKLKRIFINRQRGIFENCRYLPQIMFLYLRYSKYLEDDFTDRKTSFLAFFTDLVERLSPFFWAVTDEEDNTAGFIYLENFTGSNGNLYSAEITTCFSQKYWGKYTYITGVIFLKYCIEVLGLKKIKAVIYKENFRVKTLLKKLGFQKEALHPAETMKNGKPQDIEEWGFISERT